MVNAKKNAKAVGNKIKIDPVMMAMMEERIRQRVEEEKRKLETEMRPAQEGPVLSPEEIKELQEYRKKFAELEEAKQTLVCSCIAVPGFLCVSGEVFPMSLCRYCRCMACRPRQRAKSTDLATKCHLRCNLKFNG